MFSFTPRPLNPLGNTPGTHWIGDWEGPRAGLDAVEIDKFSAPVGNRTHEPRSSSP